MKINFNEVVEYLDQRTAYDIDDIEDYLVAEMEYLEAKGIITTDPEKAEEFERYAAEHPEDAPTIDMEKMFEYIEIRTGLPEAMIEVMAFTELYFKTVVLTGLKGISLEEFLMQYL